MKRFYDKAEARLDGELWIIKLDDRPVRTPQRRELAVLSEALARELADEWQVQGDRVDPLSMPINRLTQTALDRVAPNRDEVLKQLVGYAASDLLCYRADQPESLVGRQQERWDPPLRWLAQTHGVDLIVTQGLMPVAQPAGALDRLQGRLSEIDDFRLTGLHVIAGNMASVTLGLAVSEGAMDWQDAWAAARLDEEFQAEQWGRDSEAEARVAAMQEEVAQAVRFLDLL